ncbi:pseudouridine synthase [Methanosarcinales archaeon]|nr:MAG: pseudouridine synthase [Methanosarcinales archaeon]
MDEDEQHNKALKKVRMIADYQFGRGSGRVLFPHNVDFTFSSTGRVRQIKLSGEHVATLRAKDGLLVLGMRGGEMLKSFHRPMRHRVVLSEEAVPFVREGRSAFAKFVVSCDKEIRGRDEVLVVDESDELLAVGEAMLCAREMMEAMKGVAVKIRHGGGLYED